MSMKIGFVLAMALIISAAYPLNAMGQGLVGHPDVDKTANETAPSKEGTVTGLLNGKLKQSVQSDLSLPPDRTVRNGEDSIVELMKLQTIARQKLREELEEEKQKTARLTRERDAETAKTGGLLMVSTVLFLLLVVAIVWACVWGRRATNNHQSVSKF